MFDSIIHPDDRNWGVVVGSRVGFDSTYNGGWAAARTGQRVTLRDNMSVVALFVLSFFCISKVMLMQLACSRDESWWLKSRLFLKN